MPKGLRVCLKEPDFSKMKDRVEESHDAIVIMQKDIEEIKYCLKGNGVPGLVEKVDCHEKFITSSKGQIDLAKWFFGGGFVFSCIALGMALWELFH